jgi:hypothetical protein
VCKEGDRAMTPGAVDLDAADYLLASAAILVGDEPQNVLALLMTAAASLILDAHEPDVAAAAAAAAGAGPPLAEMVQTLAAVRLGESRAGGSA